MINKIAITFALLLFFQIINAQTKKIADSIRVAYNIPELGYAVISSTSIIELDVAGVKKINSTLAAELNDRFRIGSNTKAITGFIAAQLVKDKKLNWNTKFFDLFPELKATSKHAYYNATLLDLLTFRAELIPYTYTNDVPVKDQFTGNEDAQLYQFCKWFFQQKPVKGKDTIHFSNLGYIAAAIMMEKASGKTYRMLVTDLGKELGIAFYFGNPNFTDTLQPWGHGDDLKSEAPADNYKLNWLMPAGNINVSLPDYIKFIQLQLQGLNGISTLLSKEEFNFLHYGLPHFAVGWFWNFDEQRQLYSYNVGNPGTFLTKVYVYKNADRAFIIFCNAQTDNADKGIDILYNKLKRVFNN